MFKLQRLEITGFKSFADYTEVVFTGNGITAVVGPNGCGKSNVSDAISWVLGEQRAKSLRGGEMKDVVFQGTKNRKPSGMAEVVLHLVRDEEAFDIDDTELEDIDETLSEIDELAVDVDALEAEHSEPVTAVAELKAETSANGNGHHSEELEVERVQAAQVGSVQTVERTVKAKRHWRPRSFALDFAPGEAISVARRLYLSGESEYLLNGKACRLRDIQDLFAGTGLSGAHYAIIEQGRIGQILSAKPADRRNLIEEAAGISKFRTRQRAAESRLESAKTNLGRISDIVSEIEKQANSLRRQAAKTRRYVALQEDFRLLLRQLYSAEGSHYATLIERLESELAAAVAAERELVAKVENQEARFREATQNARNAEEALAEVRRLHSENALERDRTEREHKYRQEQITGLEQREVAIRAEIAAAAERARLAEQERERLAVEDERESAEADANRQILIEAEAVYAERVDDVRKIEAELEVKRSEQFKHTAAIERFEEIVRQLNLNIDRLGQRSAGLMLEGRRAADTHQEHIAEAARVAAELTAEREKLENLNKERQEILASAEASRERLRASESELRSAADELARTKNRLETLQELEERRAVYTPQVQRVFAEQDEIGVAPLGVLADFLNVSERAEPAVESVFGSLLQTVLVNDLEDARKVSDWARSNSVGRIAVLIAPDARKTDPSRSANGQPATIAAALGADDYLIETLNRVFPREMAARITASLDNAESGLADILVAEDGEMLIGGSLYMSSAIDAGDEKNSSLLAFKRELSDLEKSVATLEEAYRKAEERVAADRLSLADTEEKTVDLQSLIIKVERHLLSLELHEKTVKQEIERAERHKKVVVDESDEVEREVAEMRGRISEADSGRELAGAAVAEIQKEIDAIAERMSAARERAEAENAVLNEKRTIAATSGERRRSVQSALKRVENEKAELELRIANLNRELTQTEERIAELRQTVARIEERMAAVDAELAGENEELNTALQNVGAAREAADAASTELAALNHTSAEAMNERAAVEVKQAEAVTNLKNLKENCLQELGTPLFELVQSESVPEDFPLEDARERTDDLRKRLEGFGAINMLAVEELAEAEERLLFLTSQRQDIISSIASAEEALREIKERSRERFRHAFEAINENFKQFFSELFGGGRGEMSLLESDDILEAGIEVVAQPPGKRLQNILLLSGGEKAMTAIALVLAIFKYRPSPFCLLDEVDAPLDDANVGRFVNKIAEMSEKTQFIVITHNKRTMEAARALYGVTMQEAGISKVVSVRFE